MLKRQDDAFGEAFLAYHRGERPPEIIERDDGYIDVGASFGLAGYFASFKKWPAIERKAIRFARGRVLDIGCGPGRVALYLQEKGMEAVGIDISPLAIKVARERGLKQARAMSITDISPRLGIFDTIVMLGNNFGLFASYRQAKRLLRRFHRLTSERGRLIVESGNIYGTTVKEHLEYQKRNRARGRMSGQVRLRVRYWRKKTPWFDYLLVSPEEMDDILKGTGWRTYRRFDPGKFLYTTVIEKE